VALVAFVVHPLRPEAQELADRAVKWLEARGHATVTWDGGAGGNADASAGPGADAIVFEDLEPDLDGERADLAVSLGGDGTMLRTVALAASRGVPVLGVNVGHLGYLTEVEPSGLEEGLGRFLAGDYQVEERLTLQALLEQGQPGARPALRQRLVINDAAIERTEPGHTIRVAASIAGRHFVTYAADGLLVATPTGSTAYNLSVRGPILSPGLRALVLVPLAPHMLFDRALVLEPHQWLRLELVGSRPAVLVMDGQRVADLDPGDVVVCRASPTPARLVTFGGRDFHAILRARFHLGDR